MTVEDHINNLLQIVKNNPKVANYKCIYATDDEGNSYDRVKFTATVMKAESLQNQNLKIEEVNNSDEGNVLCIN